MVYDMSSTPITVVTRIRRTSAVYYDGSNAPAVEELAHGTGQAIAGVKGSLRYWSLADEAQRLIEPRSWVIIDSNNELLAMDEYQFHQHWEVGAQGTTIEVVEPTPESEVSEIYGQPVVASEGEVLPQAPPTPNAAGPLIPGALAGEPGVEMTPDEFAEWRKAKAAEAGDPPSTPAAEPESSTDPLDNYEMPDDDEPDTVDVEPVGDPDEATTIVVEDAPRVNDDGTPWSKAQWIELRAGQGYSPNAMSKLPIPVLSVLPDTPPTEVAS